jgi:hypothetical protein
MNMIGYELEASASSGRAGAKGETTGHATGHTSFLGPSFGRFVLGVLFLALVLGVLVPGLLAPVLSFLAFFAPGVLSSFLEWSAATRPIVAYTVCGASVLKCLGQGCIEGLYKEVF